MQFLFADTAITSPEGLFGGGLLITVGIIARAAYPKIRDAIQEWWARNDKKHTQSRQEAIDDADRERKQRKEDESEYILRLEGLNDRLNEDRKHCEDANEKLRKDLHDMQNFWHKELLEVKVAVVQYAARVDLLETLLREKKIPPPPWERKPIGLTVAQTTQEEKK